MGYVSHLAEAYMAQKSNPSQQPDDPQTYTKIKTGIETLWLEYTSEAANAD
jgi:hypothetical protein